MDDTCKTCGHSREDHKGTATICMKQIGQTPDRICYCCYFDDGKLHELPVARGWQQEVTNTTEIAQKSEPK